MKKKLPSIALWAIAILLTLRLTYSAIQHHLPTADTLAIAAAVLFATRMGLDTIARSAKAVRKQGADQR